MAGEINDVAGTITKFIDTLNELSAKSAGVISSLEGLKEHSSTVATDYDHLRDLTEKIHTCINALSAMSADFTKALEENDYEMISRLNAELMER
jgi:ABC-type transporter Mla subunit MlaD